MSCILGNTSTIEKLQKKRAQKEGTSVKTKEKEDRSTQRSSWENLCEVMNGDYRDGF